MLFFFCTCKAQLAGYPAVDSLSSIIDKLRILDSLNPGQCQSEIEYLQKIRRQKLAAIEENKTKTGLNQ